MLVDEEAMLDSAELRFTGGEVAETSGGAIIAGVLVFAVLEAAFRVSEKCLDWPAKLKAGTGAYCFLLLAISKH